MRSTATLFRSELPTKKATLHSQLGRLQVRRLEVGGAAAISAASPLSPCALAAEMREVYPAVQSKLVDVLTRKKACDAKVGRINRSAPPGVALRLREVELVARDLDGFTRDEPSIANELRLPDWEQPNKLAWPRPQTPLAVLAVQGMAAAVDHPGDNWWRRCDERQR